ncbi:acyl carrier protein [Oligella urethralis]|uniref:Phosphopantetheine attachment site n=1 Tax=Oligella urethralis TaxID=90245 RepID=A0A2X1WT58_9BURK|nr:acyl carrier protein [Oligella urethralis]SPY31733.1 Phosphopantetheine attachment site [Oligella urethralis]
MQEELIMMVAKTLGISLDDIDVNENLLVLGLHSLALMSIAEQIAQRFDKTIGLPETDAESDD